MKLLPSPLWELLYPRRCAACRRRGEWLCEACVGRCVPHGDGCCPRCGSRPFGSTCATCSRRIRHLDGLRAAYTYSGPVRDLVHSFKYDGLHAAAGWMASQMPVDWLPPGAVLVPVPLHPARQKERGYNQSELLARALGKRAGLPTVDALERVRRTPPQAHQDAAGRWLNIRDAFEAQRGIGPARVAVLVDDVCTTGATLEECAWVLVSAGAERVVGLVFARA
jgi:ComF family protein